MSVPGQPLTAAEELFYEHQFKILDSHYHAPYDPAIDGGHIPYEEHGPLIMGECPQCGAPLKRKGRFGTRLSACTECSFVDTDEMDERNVFVRDVRI